MKIRIYKNGFSADQATLHVQVPKRDQFVDNCLILKLRKYHSAFILADKGEIFGSISADYVNGRINSLTYRHFVNEYAIEHDNNLQIISTKTNLVNIIHNSLYQHGVNDYLKFIHSLHNRGIQFKKTYHSTLHPR